MIVVNLVYQTTGRLRNVELLDLDNPPMVYQLQLKGLNRNADGLYSLEDVNGRFEKAIAAYDDIK